MATNKTILNPGYVGHKPIKKFNEKLQCDQIEFTIAPINTRKKQDNETESTEWWTIIAYGALAQIIEQYVDKGSFVQISGENISYAYLPEKGINIGKAMLNRKLKMNTHHDLILLPKNKSAIEATVSSVGGGHSNTDDHINYNLSPNKVNLSDTDDIPF